MTEKVLVGMSESISQSKESLFSTEDVVPVFFRFEETINLLEKPIVIKAKDITQCFILDHPIYGQLDNRTLDNLIKGVGYFDQATFDYYTFDYDPTVTYKCVIPVGDLYVEDLGEYSFVDFVNTTASISAHRIDGNSGDVYQSNWILYNSSKTYSKATFSFGETDNNLDWSVDQLYVSTDDQNWTLISPSNVYNGSFNNLKFKIVFGADGRYVSFKDPNTKTLKTMSVIFTI